jgi:NAD(P)-dependent dehydrogenase (short-subunit alcohol dehydrogenase family)
MESAKLLWSALTSTLAAELAATPVIVNAVCPGLTRPTQAQPAMGARPVAQSAAGLVWAATLPGDGRAVGSSAMDSLWTAAARDALRHRHGASIRWPHRESIA